MASTFLQLHIPVRNLSRFDKCLVIGGDYGDYLLIPQTLMYNGLYSGDDWINRKQIFFYPNESYVLVTACSHSEKETRQRELLENVLPILYEVVCKFPQNSLVPHALDLKDMVPQNGTLENHSVKINPAVQPASSINLDDFTRSFADLIRPYYANEVGSPTFLSQLLSEKKKWEVKDFNRIIELANIKLHIDHQSHMSSILGGLIIDFLGLDELDHEFSNISENRMKWRLRVIKRLFSRRLIDLIVDFCADYLSKKVEGSHSYNRRYWEHSRFDHPTYFQKLDISKAPSAIANNDFLSSEVKYFDSNKVSRLREAVHNSVIDISQGKSAAQIFERNINMQFYGVFEQFNIVRRPLNLNRLSYYIETFSSSRVGVKFLHLYQVIENMMVQGGGSEKDQIKSIFQNHIYSNLPAPLVNNFVTQISANAIGTNFSNLIPTSNVSDDIALSVYGLRCALVHSKSSSGSNNNFINPYSNEEYKLVPPYLDLMDKVANILVQIP